MKAWQMAGAAALLLAACRQGGESEAGGAAEATPTAGTPVRVVAVERADLARIVSGPGRTVALVQQKVRAPFAGTLVELTVTDGDAVKAGQRVGAIVARESEAALAGAQEMLREAHTPAETRDAERALALARSHEVRRPLATAVSGFVLSHAANAGDRVTEGEDILTVSAADSLVFQADLAQADLASIKPGRRTVVEIAGRPTALTGRVHGFLGAANATDLTLPVRIDLTPLPTQLAVGLFGTARITVAEHRNVPTLPAAAVLRDDVTGVSRVATVGAQGRAHWVEVKPGLVDAGKVEILGPDLGQARVIVSGQVGLPEGAPVVVQL
jgi:multidrug efflux pump subunit AcrA (membrane-fusion protein)